MKQLEEEDEEREEGEEMKTKTHTDQLWYWNEFQSLVAKLSALGLRDRFLSHSTVSSPLRIKWACLIILIN